MDESGIGKRLRNIRRSRMWNQRKLAEEAGVSPTTVSGIETGRIARPHFGTLHKLAQALEVDPQELLYPSEEPSSASEELSGLESSPFLSLQWARSTRVESFDQLIE